MMDEKKDKANEQTLTKSVLILPNKQISDLNNTSQYCHLDNSSNSSVSCVPKLSVHYIVSLNNESLISSCKSSTAESSAKLETIDCERKCLISLPIDGHHTDCELIKGHHSVANQRLLISPTDFLTLSEEGVTHKSSAVRKDVNLSTSSVELIRRSNSDNNFAICLDRYCESPLLLEHKDSQLICEDETSCNGRNSRLSETPEDMTADELFASTFGGDQSNSLREVVTPIEVDSARNTPTLLNKDSNNTKTKSNLETLLCEDIKPNIEAIGTKPVLTILDPLETETNNNDCSSSQSHSESSFSLISSRADSTASPSQSLSLATLDIKVLPTGLLAKDSILLANLAAALPSSLTSRQIAVQVIREDGTSLVLPINTKHDSSGSAGVVPKQVNSDLAVSTSVVLAEMVAPNASIRPFKCELCNSTFTRLGNYTRHKKIHSFPSKEDQRFRCDICNKSFIQRCDLARHLHIHRGTEPHRCSQCGKGYIRHSDLVTHQRFHNKEKPFSCPHCSKGFCQRGDLNRHLRSIHLQLKPILCSHCHKKFAKEETLLRHINANHRELIEEATDPQFK